MVMHRKPNTQMGQSVPIKAEVETDQTGELVLIKEEVETDQTQESVTVKTEVATYRTAESVPLKTEVQTGESVPINPMVQAALSNVNKTGGCMYKGIRMGTERARLAGYKMQHYNIMYGRDCYFKQSASTAEISLSGTTHPIAHVDNIEIDHVSVKTEPYHENNNAPLSLIREAKYISAIDVEDNTEHIAYPVRLYRNVHMIAFLAQNALGPVIFEKCVASTDCETSPHTRVTERQDTGDCLSSEESVGHSSCQQTSTDRKFGKGTVDIHRVAQGSEEPNVRKLYDNIVANPSSLKIHTKTNRAGKGYICIQCDAAFEQSSHLKHHMLTHTGNKHYMHICKQCDIAFDSTAMKSHMQTRMGEKRYECYQCDASFTNSSNLKKHIRIHTGEKPYVCKQCNAAFARSYNLTTHMSTHTGDRPYVCKQCDAAFTQSHNLKKHMFTHSGCKAFVCTQCDVAFTQSSRLKRHMLTHSSSKAETTFDDTELHCIAEVRKATELNQTPPTHAGNRGTGQVHVKTEHRDDNSHTPLSTVQEAKYISPMDDKDQPEPTVYHVGLDQNIQLTAHLDENVHGPVMSEKCDGEICPHTWVTGGQNTSDCLVSENSVRHNSHQHIAAASDRGGYNTHTSPSSLKIHTQTRKDGGHNTSDSVEHLTHQQTSADRDNNKGTLGADWMAQGDAMPNVCKQYDSVVTNPSSLKLHTWTSKENKRYTCNAVFGCLSHLDRHIRAHTGDRPYICEQCDAKFTHSTSLKSHMRTHTGEKPYSCKQCDAAFTHSTNLKNHMRTHTGEKPYACKQCGAAFIYSTALKNHVRTHTGEKPYLCKLCDSTFSTSKLLKIHMTRHTGDRRFACEQCGFAFFESCALKKHIQTHTGDKPYTCKLCNAAFTTSSNLKVHMRIHTGDKPFVCKQCNAAFTRSTYLREHIRIHTGDKPFVCKHCSAAFTQASTLNTHMRTHASYRPFVCKQCDASFRHSRHLESHVQIHMGDKPYVCKQCYAAFTQSRSLKRHMRIHTRAKSRVNTECDATVVQSGSLKKHMLTRSCSKTETFDEAGWVPIGLARNATILNQASPTLVDDIESGHVHMKTEYYDANIHTTMSTIQETKVASSIDDEDKPEHTVYPVGLYQNVHVAAHLMENVHGPVMSEKCDARDDTAYPNSCVTGAQNTMQYLGSVCR